MALAEETPSNSYIGNGSAVEFDLEWTFSDEADVRVFLDGVLQSAGFTVSEGSVTFDVAPATGVAIVLTRNTPLDQPSSFEDPQTASLSDLAFSLDRTVRQNQEQKAESDRCLKVSVGSEPPLIEPGKILIGREDASSYDSVFPSQVVAAASVAAAEDIESARQAAVNAENAAAMFVSSEIDNIPNINPGLINSTDPIPDHILQHLFHISSTTVAVDHPSSIRSTIVPALSPIGTPGLPLEEADVIECAWLLLGVGSPGHQPYSRWNDGDRVWPNNGFDARLNGKIIFREGFYNLSRNIVFPARIQIEGAGAWHHGQRGTVFTPTDDYALAETIPLLSWRSSSGDGNYTSNFNQHGGRFSIRCVEKCSGISWTGAQCSHLYEIDIDELPPTGFGLDVPGIGGRNMTVRDLHVRSNNETSTAIKVGARNRISFVQLSTNHVGVGMDIGTLSSVTLVGGSFEQSYRRIIRKGIRGALHGTGLQIKEFADALGDGIAFETGANGVVELSGASSFIQPDEPGYEPVTGRNWVHGGVIQGSAFSQTVDEGGFFISSSVPEKGGSEYFGEHTHEGSLNVNGGFTQEGVNLFREYVATKNVQVTKTTLHAGEIQQIPLPLPAGVTGDRMFVEYKVLVDSDPTGDNNYFYQSGELILINETGWLVPNPNALNVVSRTETGSNIDFGSSVTNFENHSSADGIQFLLTVAAGSSTGGNYSLKIQVKYSVL